MFEPNNLKLNILSKTKTELKYDIPVFITGYDRSIDNISISLRYKYNEDTKQYHLINKSLRKTIEYYTFKNKVGKNYNMYKYIIKPNFVDYIKIDDIWYWEIPTLLVIEDKNYIVELRDRRINSIIS